jgi:hypothetical protein
MPRALSIVVAFAALKAGAERPASWQAERSCPLSSALGLERIGALSG